MKGEGKIVILQEIIRIKSVNGNEGEVAAYLNKLLAKYDVAGEIVPYRDGRGNLTACYQKDQSGKVLGLSGHMDVVAVGDESSWTYTPLVAEIHENRLYGRGAADMKSGLTTMVITVIELKESGKPFNGTVKLLATIGEEANELGGEQFTKVGYADDLDTLIIGEPTNYSLIHTHTGSTNYTATSCGREAYSSMSDQGYNTINHLDELITKANAEMNRLTEAVKNPVLGRAIYNAISISDGNQVNSTPSHAQLQGNIRSIPEYPNDKVVALLQSIVNELNRETGYHLESMIDYNKIPVRANPDSPLIHCAQQRFSQPLPLVGTVVTTGAAEFTKANHSFDSVVFGPGVVALPHQVDGYVEIDSYLDMIEKYQGIILSYLV